MLIPARSARNDTRDAPRGWNPTREQHRERENANHTDILIGSVVGEIETQRSEHSRASSAPRPKSPHRLDAARHPAESRAADASTLVASATRRHLAVRAATASYSTP